MKKLLIFLIVAVVLLGVWLFFQILEPYLIYFPTRTLEATPADIGLAYEDVFLTTEDGVRIHGWFLPNPSATWTILFFHGNGGNISHSLKRLQVFQQLNLQTLIFDYRGYGQSEGFPSEKGLYVDALTMYEYLVQQKGIPPGRMILYGGSLGGGVAIDLATRVPVAALICEGCFPSIIEIGKIAYPFLPVSLLARSRYDSLKKVPHLTMPKLFLHARKDEVVPFELGFRLYQASAEPKTFFELKGGHNDAFLVTGEPLLQQLKNFFYRLKPVNGGETK